MTTRFENMMQVLNDSIASLDSLVFDRLVDECTNSLKNGGRIIVSGLGKNVSVCEKFVGSMVSLGLDASFMHTNSAVHGDIGMVRPGDVVIVLTKSGETAESILLANLLLQRNANTWLLSFSRQSTLTKLLGMEKCLILDIKEEGDPWNIMPINSTTVNLIVLQELSMMILEKMQISLESFKKNHPGGAIGRILSKQDVK